MPYTFNPLSGQFDYYSDLSGYVPFTGSDQDVDLGAYDLICTDATIKQALNLGNSGEFTVTFIDDTVPAYFKYENFLNTGGEYSKIFKLCDTSDPIYYPDGYEPMVLISRVQTAPYQGAVGLQAWASSNGAGTDFGEAFGFWGGVRDDGNDAGDYSGTTSLGVVGIMCWNTFWATNSRIIYRITGGYFTSEVPDSVTNTYCIGGVFQSVTAGNGIITYADGVNIKNINSANSPSIVIDKNRGLVVEDMTRSGSNNFSIYTDKSLSLFGGGIAVLKLDSVGSECLNNTALTFASGKWTPAGDCAWNVGTLGKARFIHSAGVGTLTQASADLATALKPNTWYRFDCIFSSTSGVLPRLSITTSVADEDIYIPKDVSYVYFKTNAAPGDFVIASASAVAGQVYLDTLTLKEVTDGDAYIGGDLTVKGNGYFPSDSIKQYFGFGNDMTIWYDGTDGNINTSDVAASDLNITCGAAKTLELQTGVYEDLQFSVSSAKVPAANYPDWETFTTNTAEYSFAVDDYIDCQANEVPHSWQEGTAGDAHLHLALKAAQSDGADRFAKFSLYFAISDSSQAGTKVWSELTTRTAEITIPTGTAALTGLYLDMGDLTLTGYKVGSQIRVRIKRIAATGGTEYNSQIFITQVGVHLKRDTIGSRQETIK